MSAALVDICLQRTSSSKSLSIPQSFVQGHWWLLKQKKETSSSSFLMIWKFNGDLMILTAMLMQKRRQSIKKLLTVDTIRNTFTGTENYVGTLRKSFDSSSIASRFARAFTLPRLSIEWISSSRSEGDFQSLREDRKNRRWWLKPP